MTSPFGRYLVCRVCAQHKQQVGRSALSHLVCIAGQGPQKGKKILSASWNIPPANSRTLVGGTLRARHPCTPQLQTLRIHASKQPRRSGCIQTDEKSRKKNSHQVFIGFPAPSLVVASSKRRCGSRPRSANQTANIKRKDHTKREGRCR